MSSILTNLQSTASWWFGQYTPLCDDPANISKHFVGFGEDEAVNKERAVLETAYVALNASREPIVTGTIDARSTLPRETLNIKLRCCKKVKEGDWVAQTAAKDFCRTTLHNFISWCWATSSGPNKCDYPVLELMRLDSISQYDLNEIGIGGFVGWELGITLTGKLDTTYEFDGDGLPVVVVVRKTTTLFHLGNGSTTLQLNALIGAEIVGIYTDGRLRNHTTDAPPQEVSFNTATGTLTFGSEQYAETVIAVQYISAL